MFRKFSIFWIVVIALLITSALPLAIMVVRAVQTTESGVEAEQRNQLLARADAHASSIDQQFKKFEIATLLAATEAQQLLMNQQAALSDDEIAERMAKYRREGGEEVAEREVQQETYGAGILYDQGDNRYELGVLGLDHWYNTRFLAENPGSNRASNVFLSNHAAQTPEIAYQIAATEDLNAVFGSIVDSNIGSQWVYLTTAEGMMRLYPWAGNYKYPVNWQPHNEIFYTVAAEERNPGRGSVWTAPYNDFARAGVMVTNAVPIYDGDELIGVMSNDLVIRDLQAQVLGFRVGEKGFAFLIDSRGNIVAHPQFNAEDTPLGQELNIRLADQDPGMAPVVQDMLSSERGISSYTGPDGAQWLVTYSTIPTTLWHVGLMQPRSEIIQPAIDIQNNLAPVSALLIVFVLLMSVLVARGIAHPTRQVTTVAEKIRNSVDDPARASEAVKELLAVGGTSEISRLVTVFRDMVAVLRRRMNELDSIYAIGQTVTSNVEYDKTMQAVLSAMRQVVDYDAAEIALVQGDDLVVQGWQGRTGFRDTTGRTQKLGYGALGAVASSKAPVLMPAVRSVDEARQLLNQPDFDGKLILESGLKSLLGIPLLIGDKLIGVLMLIHTKEGHFTEDDKRQLAKLSAQASVAISNATNVRQRESVLKKQIRELQIEIDESKKSKQVSEIVESDFFRDLQQKAESIRARSRVPASAPKRE
jgi:putative methionine-R-sulfoxide reductase with GAF domain